MADQIEIKPDRILFTDPTTGNIRGFRLNNDLLDMVTGALGYIQRVNNIAYGVYGDMPSAGTTGLFYYATDYKTLYLDDGTSWNLINATLYCSFYAGLSATSENQTGDGTVYTLVGDTEIFDLLGNHNPVNGVFTAPYTGQYYLHGQVVLDDVAAGHTRAYISIVTSNRTFYGTWLHGGNVMDVGNNLSLSCQAVVDMDANDTAYVTVLVDGGAKVVDIQGTAAIGHSFFCGNLMG